MKRLLLATTLLLSTFTASAAVEFSKEQLDVLQYAYAYGNQFTVKGKKDEIRPDDKSGLGHVMAGIAWQESSAGANMGRKPGHHAYGIFQNYIKTVRAKIDANKLGVKDCEIKAMLEQRHHSAQWAMDELQYWLKVRNGNIRLALASYNAGWDYKAGLGYADAVLKKSKYLKRNTLQRVD